MARGLIGALGAGPLALSEVTIYLPTRRAARTFGEAFARVLGGAALLPEFRALGDSDEDDSLFDTLSDGLELPPAIAPIRRQLLLASLIGAGSESRGEPMPFAQAAALADSLAQVMDDVETPGRRSCQAGRIWRRRRWRRIGRISARFLALIRDEWPALLTAEGAVNPAARRNLALQMLAERLAKESAVRHGDRGGLDRLHSRHGGTAGRDRAICRTARWCCRGSTADWTRKAGAISIPAIRNIGLKQLLESIGATRVPM